MSSGSTLLESEVRRKKHVGPPRPVAESAVMEMLYGCGGTNTRSRGYPEIACAITRAANDQPLFPEHVSGSESTAALLVALAWRTSQFDAGASRGGGANLGLYLLRVPQGLSVRGTMLMLPRSASLVAVDQIGVSLAEDAERIWPERLTTFFRENQIRGITVSDGILVRRSVDVMRLALQIFVLKYPRAATPLALPAPSRRTRP